MFDSVADRAVEAVCSEPSDRPVYVEGVAEFRERSGAAVDGDDGRTVHHDEDVAGVPSPVAIAVRT